MCHLYFSLSQRYNLIFSQLRVQVNKRYLFVAIFLVRKQGSTHPVGPHYSEAAAARDLPVVGVQFFLRKC